MSKRALVLWPDPRLSQRSVPVEDPGSVAALAEDMLEIMYHARGRGLAAVQIGVHQRLFVMDCGWKEGHPTPRVCINPEIIWYSDAQETGVEGCLSIPETPAEVLRPQAITLRWQDVSGHWLQRDLSGFEARCAQHEFDHLEGRVILDHLPPDMRTALESTYLEARQ